MKVTMQDVANHAGVDKATVSRVLRGDHRISEKTKIKVMESVRALDYKLDRNARNLSTNTSGLIGVVLRDLNRPWLGAFLAGIDRAFANSEGNAMRARRELSTLDGRHVEGLIWGDAENFPREPRVPAVCLGFTAPGAYSVTMEDAADEPSFETGVLVGRMMLKIVAGKPVPGREIRVMRSREGD